ncbi:MAG: hypothetical protein EBS39_09945 [Gammaproteobacteria bacterium]|nr:hypothetical protein [Gammaproteobacteria bacterium]
MRLFPYDRPASTGEVLDAGFMLFRRTLPSCLPWSLLAVVSGNLPSAYQLLSGRSLSLLAPKDPLWWTLLCVAALSNLWVWTLIVRRQLGVARGAPRGLAADAWSALKRLPQSLGVVFGAVLLVLLGLLLLVAPGLYLGVALWPCLTVLTAEEGGVRAAVDRTLQLVRGNWWHTATILGVASSALLALYVVGVLAAMALTQVAGGLDRSSATLALTLVSALLAGVFQPMLTALGVAQYADLARRAAERAPAAA